MKIIRFIYNIISVLLVAAIIALTVLALLLGVSGIDRQNPKSILGFRSFIVLSPSMVPTFDEGSLIIIKETALNKLQIGDIITYKPLKDDDTLLTHRIVKISGEAPNALIVTRGDANNIDDPNPVSPDTILGKTVFHMNGLGSFIVNLRTPPGIAAMIGVIAVGLFLIPYLLAPRKKINQSASSKADSEENKTKDVNEIKIKNIEEGDEKKSDDSDPD